MRTSRQTDIRRALLTALSFLPAGYMLASELLAKDAARTVIPAPTTTEFESELRAADTSRLVVGVVGEDCIRWKITDSGRAWLSENP